MPGVYYLELFFFFLFFFLYINHYLVERVLYTQFFSNMHYSIVFIFPLARFALLVAIGFGRSHRISKFPSPVHLP